jgi:hypothetical protein
MAQALPRFFRSAACCSTSSRSFGSRCLFLTTTPDWNLRPSQQEQDANQERHQVMQKGRGITADPY